MATIRNYRVPGTTIELVIGLIVHFVRVLVIGRRLDELDKGMAD